MAIEMAANEFAELQKGTYQDTKHLHFDGNFFGPKMAKDQTKGETLLFCLFLWFLVFGPNAIAHTHTHIHKKQKYEEGLHSQVLGPEKKCQQ